MAEGDRGHPILVDSDALIAVANTQLWPAVRGTLNVSTTNVCIAELKRHVREKSGYAPDGSREKWVHDGSHAALEPFEDPEDSAFTVVTSVPRPHGPDAGETSIKQEIEQYPGTYRYAMLMDEAGRIMINRLFERQEDEGAAVAPTFLLYLVYSAGACTEEEFCEACGEMLEGEGWTAYKAVQAAWDAIPVDCSHVLPDDLLP